MRFLISFVAVVVGHPGAGEVEMKPLGHLSSSSVSPKHRVEHSLPADPGAPPTSHTTKPIESGDRHSTPVGVSGGLGGLVEMKPISRSVTPDIHGDDEIDVASAVRGTSPSHSTETSSPPSGHTKASGRSSPVGVRGDAGMIELGTFSASKPYSIVVDTHDVVVERKGVCTLKLSIRELDWPVGAQVAPDLGLVDSGEMEPCVEDLAGMVSALFTRGGLAERIPGILPFGIVGSRLFVSSDEKSGARFPVFTCDFGVAGRSWDDEYVVRAPAVADTILKAIRRDSSRLPALRAWFAAKGCAHLAQMRRDLLERSTGWSGVHSQWMGAFQASIDRDGGMFIHHHGRHPVVLASLKPGLVVIKSDRNCRLSFGMGNGYEASIASTGRVELYQAALAAAIPGACLDLAGPYGTAAKPDSTAIVTEGSLGSVTVTCTKKFLFGADEPVGHFDFISDGIVMLPTSRKGTVDESLLEEHACVRLEKLRKAIIKILKLDLH